MFFGNLVSQKKGTISLEILKFSIGNAEEICNEFAERIANYQKISESISGRAAEGVLKVFSNKCPNYCL